MDGQAGFKTKSKFSSAYALVHSSAIFYHLNYLSHLPTRWWPLLRSHGLLTTSTQMLTLLLSTILCLFPKDPSEYK